MRVTNGSTAKCTASHAIFPIGGTVDGVDQMVHHRDKRAEIPHGESVTITGEKVAKVTTYGNENGSLKDAKVAVVKVAGKPGWYMKNGFLC